MSEARAKCVASIVELLVNGRYQDLEAISGGIRLSAEELAQSVAQYGRTLVMPPDTGPTPDYIAVRDRVSPTWSVAVPLFTSEEGRSDLTLELTLVQVQAETFSVQIDDLHVL